MRRESIFAFVLVLVCMLLIAGCGNDATGGTTANVTKPFVTQYPKVSYKLFTQQDFSMKYPDWEKSVSGGEERQMSLKGGICTLTLNRYNALPDDLFEFLKSTVSSSGYVLANSGKDDGLYFLDYDMPQENYDVFAQMRLNYCDYQTYSTTLLCVKQNYDDHHEKIADTIFDSIGCGKEYATFPPPEKLAEEGMIKTDEGEKYGLNSRAVVYQINNNKFLMEKLSQFSRINFVFERQEFGIEAKFKVQINNSKITLVDDRNFNEADVTIYMPLMEALNALANAQHIDASNIGFFLKNMGTEPESVKKIILG